MKKYILKSLLFALPVFVYLILSYYFMMRINEHLPVSSVIERQQSSTNESYYNRILFENVLDLYKYKTMLQRQPKVLVLGQSIVLSFRDFFVSPFNQSFYNTGLMVRNIHELENISNQLIDGTLTKPTYIIFGLDHSFVLKKDLFDTKSIKTSYWQDPFFDSKKQLRAMQEVMLKSDVREIPNIDVGYGKRGMVGNGYRKDGSCNNKWEIDLFTKDSTHIEGSLINEFKNHGNAYPIDMVFDEQKANRLTNCLNKLRNNQIELLIYVPVLSDSFYTYASQHQHFNSFWKEYLQFQNQLIQSKFNVIPFATPSSLGLNDYYMLNANHPGEVLVAKQFVQFYKNKAVLGPVSSSFDLKSLESKLLSTQHPLSFQIESY